MAEMLPALRRLAQQMQGVQTPA